MKNLEQVRPATEIDEKKGTIQIDPENLETVDFGSTNPKNQEEIENLEQVRSAINPEEETNEINFSDEITEFDNACEMLGTIYDDVLEGLRKTKKRTFRLEGNKLVHKKNGTKEYSNLANLDLEETQITLPNGTYINEKDIVKAFNNYRKENKGRTFKVKGFDTELQINRKSIKKFKKKLRELSVISLVKENKLSIFDIKRVYGKEKGEEYSKKVYLGETEETMAAGNYVNLEEIQEIVNEVFVEKTPSWIEKFKQLFKSKETNVVSIDDEELEENPELIQETNENLDNQVLAEENPELIQGTNEDLDNQVLAEETPVVNPEQDEFEVLKGYDLSQLNGKLNLEGMPYDDIKIQDLSKTATVSLEQEKNDDIKQVNLSKDAVEELKSLDYDDIKTLNLGKTR